MSETIDPYFADRLAQGREHRILCSLEIPRHQERKAEANKELTNPTIEGEVADFGWSEQAVDNLIDAVKKKHIRIASYEEGQLALELLPIPVEDLPAELGQVSELAAVKKNLDDLDRPVFGSSKERDFTYLQTTDFAVEGYMDDEAEGHRYARVFVDTTDLNKLRNIYLDPESLNITDYEYGYAFCVFAGIPFKAIDRIEVIQARKQRNRPLDLIDLDEDFDPEKEMQKQIDRLRGYLEQEN